jgi:redox-sensitive bicupin YhaK (pirin superfamily)
MTLITNLMDNITKSVEAVLAPPETNMVGDGFKVHNFFPSYNIIGEKGMSPFFLMDYNSKWIIPPSEKPRGVSPHPHRGFETVTIAYHGKVAHHDSAGNSGVIGEGDVQWMTAGSGVLHKEYHEMEFSKKGGVFQVVQIWVNLPIKFKMTAPKYQAIENKDMTRYLLDDGKSYVELIAGEYKGNKGPASTFTSMNLFNAKLKKGAVADFSFSKNYNTGLLVIEGEVNINESGKAPSDHFVLFRHDGENFKVEATVDSIVLVLSGEPINEPIASNGPFLMNTREEIKQAFDDYSSGKFGYLED